MVLYSRAIYKLIPRDELQTTIYWFFIDMERPSKSLYLQNSIQSYNNNWPAGHLDYSIPGHSNQQIYV